MHLRQRLGGLFHHDCLLSRLLLPRDCHRSGSGDFLRRGLLGFLSGGDDNLHSRSLAHGFSGCGFHAHYHTRGRGLRIKIPHSSEFKPRTFEKALRLGFVPPRQVRNNCGSGLGTSKAHEKVHSRLSGNRCGRGGTLGDDHSGRHLRVGDPDHISCGESLLLQRSEGLLILHTPHIGKRKPLSSFADFEDKDFPVLHERPRSRPLRQHQSGLLE